MADVGRSKFGLGCSLLGVGVLVGAAHPYQSAAAPTSPIHFELVISEEPVVPLDDGWRNPPSMARTQCWWWWLNGNVTKQALTQDLEAMQAKGLGGANVIDAGGANQRGHSQVPHGPDFATPEWRGLFLHALAEADRLGLELGFNIQSGWNLGGPTVEPENAAKKLTWSETTTVGGQSVELQLPLPPTVGEFYRDVAVVAFPIPPALKHRGAVYISADSAQADYSAELVIDGDASTFWVSGTDHPGAGPSTDRPELLKFEFSSSTAATEITIMPREGYGPKRGWLQAADNPQNWRVVTKWSADPAGEIVIRFPRTSAKLWRLVIVDAYDPRSPLLPRNVQIAEVEIKDGSQSLTPAAMQLARIENFRQKAYYVYPGAFTAPNADHLLKIGEATNDELAIPSADVVDLSANLRSDGRLEWDAPAGIWRIVRFGSTLSGSRVSTSSEGWNGWAVDYLDPQAFDSYWYEVVEPLLADAKQYFGRSLKYLHTDSWELGPINWTPAFPQAFAERRGYSLARYWPALAGYVVDDRTTSNRFLNDFRRTIADLIADGKYAAFREHAHTIGLGIHPESGGPHAAPIDALMCLGRNDIPMGEFWARSATHRVQDHERFFTKQASSAAHIYGKRIVLAESFTSIGPQWEESPRDLKPVFDRVACEGLNLIMLHTYDCSPDEMGWPGQAYFAGTHVNRHVTWWRHADAFFDYLNRCQFMLQQGLPVADVLYFYGENVPSFVRLKDDDPASVLPGYDYDVTNAEALIDRTAVRDGRITLPEGTSYQVLVLPSGNSYGRRTLEHIASLLAAGATVIGPKPTASIGLPSDSQDDQGFARLADRLWSSSADRGTFVYDTSSREVLRSLGVERDFIAESSGDDVPQIDFIHRRTDAADVYFVVNRLDRWQDAECSFRVAGKQPELWDPLSGDVGDAQAYRQSEGRTVVPLRFPPHGSRFVVFQRSIPRSSRGPEKYNEPRPASAGIIAGPWDVTFDQRWGGPARPVRFTDLASWTQHAEPGIKFYSGTAEYRTAFDLDAEQSARLGENRWWIDLGNVKNIAAVKLNGSELGVIWTDPFRIEVTGHLRSAGNE
jgi:hypothetical protein